MSQSVQEVLNAISEASQALNREPEYKASIASLERSLGAAQTHNQELELKAISYRTQIEQLNDRIRSLEVERDDFGFRELEANDKLDALRNVVKTFTAKVDEVMPKAVPIVEGPSMNEMREAATGEASAIEAHNYLYGVPEPLSAVSGSSSDEVVSSDNPFTPSSQDQSLSSGQKESQPTTQSGESSGQSDNPLPSAIGDQSQSQNVATSNVEIAESVGSPKPYTGLTYTAAIGQTSAPHVGLSEWLSNGGTQEDYWK